MRASPKGSIDPFLICYQADQQPSWRLFLSANQDFEIRRIHLVSFPHSEPLNIADSMSKPYNYVIGECLYRFYEPLLMIRTYGGG